MKENQASLPKNIQALFAPEYPKPGFGKILADFLMGQKVNKCNGRIETRIITTSKMLNLYAAWPGLARVYRLERQFQWRRNGSCYRTSYEVEFGIISLKRPKATPFRLLIIRRANWGIETGLHYRRDVPMHEDAIRTTVWRYRKCDGFHQQPGFGFDQAGEFSECGPGQKMVCRSHPQSFFTTNQIFFSTLRKT